jgi:hypothetical protein
VWSGDTIQSTLVDEERRTTETGGAIAAGRLTTQPPLQPNDQGRLKNARKSVGYGPMIPVCTIQTQASTIHALSFGSVRVPSDVWKEFLSSLCLMVIETFRYAPYFTVL